MVGRETFLIYLPFVRQREILGRLNKELGFFIFAPQFTDMPRPCSEILSFEVSLFEHSYDMQWPNDEVLFFDVESWQSNDVLYSLPVCSCVKRDCAGSNQYSGLFTWS